MKTDAILILGKSCPEDPPRGDRELAARAAAASAALRLGARWVATLEAQLKGQSMEGSAIVSRHLDALGVPRAQVIVDDTTCSTREEARLGARLAEERGCRRLGVITGAYHVERTRAYFAREMPTDRFNVITPTHFLQRATPEERALILAGEPSEAVLELERRRESVYALTLRPLGYLPGGARLEIAAAAAWRRVK